MLSMTIKPKIYESPDKGETIYSREFGSLDRELYSETDKARAFREIMVEAIMWQEIHRLVKINPAMKDAVDKVITIYHLIKER